MRGGEGGERGRECLLDAFDKVLFSALPFLITAKFDYFKFLRLDYFTVSETISVSSEFDIIKDISMS